MPDGANPPLRPKPAPTLDDVAKLTPSPTTPPLPRRKSMPACATRH